MSISRIILSVALPIVVTWGTMTIHERINAPAPKQATVQQSGCTDEFCTLVTKLQTKKGQEEIMDFLSAEGDKADNEWWARKLAQKE